MKTYFEEISKKYYSSGIIIDTNILLLYVIGIIDKNRIENFKRTKQFLAQDFIFLFNYLTHFSKILTTPYILTEVNNFLNQIDNREKDKFFTSFTDVINNLSEHNFTSTVLSKANDFNKFGLTDISIYELSKNTYIVLTDDLKLSSYLSNKSIDVINFNNIRTLNW